MSHVATVKVRLKDLALLAQVCGDLNLPFEKGEQEVRLYSQNVRAAASFSLSGWRYAVAVLKNGEVCFDNFQGHWGSIDELNRVLRTYAERMALRHAVRMGAAVFREERPDGTLVLRLRI